MSDLLFIDFDCRGEDIQIFSHNAYKTLLKKKLIEIMSFTINNTTKKPSATIATQLDAYYETTVSGYMSKMRLIQTSVNLQAIHQLILELL